MNVSKKLLIYLLMLSGCRVPAAGSTPDLLSCCFEEFTNGSVMYRLNQTVESANLSWNRNETPITDEVTKEVDPNIVVALGPNWITLYRNYSGIVLSIQHVHMNREKKVHCTVSCEPRNTNLHSEDPPPGFALNSAPEVGVGVFLFLVLFIVAISSMI
ncbi:hypothetical protein KOW79_015099 [Hemibagrus wyckioides]|uniref:Uncharacterized protein n=1 Tax=Hemibagrus wyckioides TaxID=337641 RepID=A0A9D3NFK5_9TELE|nr:hypothetical protein KOW79_015099 [Hemibagrus wyckioides]